MNNRRWLLSLAICALTALAPVMVLADIVFPAPKTFGCPRGHRIESDHSGPYCVPPLPTCKKGHTPRVRRTFAYCEPPPPRCPEGHRPRVIQSDAYCEPPPAKPCPTGSFWTSSSRTETFCRGGVHCTPSYPCHPRGTTCRESSLCIHHVSSSRRSYYERVHGPCKTDADCKVHEKPYLQVRCVKSRRCDPDKKHVAPASKIEPPARPVPVTKKKAPEKKTEPDNRTAPATATPRPGVKSGGCAGCATGFGSAGWPVILLLALILLYGRICFITRR